MVSPKNSWSAETPLFGPEDLRLFLEGLWAPVEGLPPDPSPERTEQTFLEVLLPLLKRAESSSREEYRLRAAQRDRLIASMAGVSSLQLTLWCEVADQKMGLSYALQARYVKWLEEGVPLKVAQSRALEGSQVELGTFAGMLAVVHLYRLYVCNRHEARRGRKLRVPTDRAAEVPLDPPRPISPGTAQRLRRALGTHYATELALGRQEIEEIDRSLLDAFGVEPSVQQRLREAGSRVVNQIQEFDAPAPQRMARIRRGMQEVVKAWRMRYPVLARIGDSSLSLTFQLVARARADNEPVLITGETGTGKEDSARAIHALSHRRSGPFIPVNLGAIPEELVESELFGYVKGAHSTALTDKPGYFEKADGGVIFLDELGEASLKVQVLAATGSFRGQVHAGWRDQREGGGRSGDRRDQP